MYGYGRGPAHGGDENRIHLFPICAGGECRILSIANPFDSAETSVQSDCPMPPLGVLGHLIVGLVSLCLLVAQSVASARRACKSPS